MAADTATSDSITHYLRPEIKDVIMKFCAPMPGAFRPLLPDPGWYLFKDDQVRLRTADDYMSTISKSGVVYVTLDVFEDKVKDIWEPWIPGTNGHDGKPAHPIGTFNECLAYTFGADIDSIGDIVTDPQVKLAVESMAQFIVQKLQAAGIEPLVRLLYSGGGIYVLLHHSLCQVAEGKDRVLEFQRVTMAFKKWLADVEYEFFQVHPECKDKVKCDKLTHQKRKFKCVLSLHKRLPFAVVPIDPDNIRIDFDRASLPLKPEVIAEAATWYDLAETADPDKFRDLLHPYLKAA